MELKLDLHLHSAASPDGRMTVEYPWPAVPVQ